MAVPHVVQKQLIKKRLLGKEGKVRLKEIKQIESELPRYNTGPYVELRRWLKEEAKKTKTRSKVKHQDWLDIKKQGIRQFVLVGSPNVGKSSLIHELSGLQTKIASYEFTTLKPIPGVVNINGAYFQIVDLPGLVEGATEDTGGGKRLIGIVKNTDGILLMHDLSKPLKEIDKVLGELIKAEIKKPMIIIGNKIDLDNGKKELNKLKKKFPGKTVIGLSNLTKKGINELKKELWKKSGLIRAYPKGKEIPIILEKNSTVHDFVGKIHKSLVDKFKLARVTGESSKFANQQVGLNHILKDKDVIEVVFER